MLVGPICPAKRERTTGIAARLTLTCCILILLLLINYYLLLLLLLFLLLLLVLLVLLLAAFSSFDVCEMYDRRTRLTLPCCIFILVTYYIFVLLLIVLLYTLLPFNPCPPCQLLSSSLRFVLLLFFFNISPFQLLS